MVARPSYYRSENDKQNIRSWGTWARIEPTSEPLAAELLTSTEVTNLNETNSVQNENTRTPVSLNRAIHLEIRKRLVAEQEAGAEPFFWLPPEKKKRAVRLLRIVKAIEGVSKRAIREKIDWFPVMPIGAFCLPAMAYAVNYILQQPDQARATLGTSNLPGVERFVTRPTKVKYKTCKTIDYLNKIDWKTHKRLNYFPGSTFIVCNPNFRLAKSRFYGGFIRSEFGATKETHVLLNKQYNLLFSTSQLSQFTNALDRLSDFQGHNAGMNRTRLSKLQYWQQPFAELDSIPIKMHHCFDLNVSAACPTWRPSPRIAPPLFQHVHQAGKIELPKIKKPFLSRFIPKIIVEHDEFTDPYVEKLSESLIKCNPGSHIRFAGNHRRIQYKIANTLAVVKDIVKWNIHSVDPLHCEFTDRDVLIEAYVKREFYLPNRLKKFSGKNVIRRPSPPNFVELDLREALQSDIYTFGEQELKMELFADAGGNPTTGLYKVKAPKSKNPFNLIYQNQKLLPLEERKANAIIPEFQKVLLAYVEEQLAAIGMPTTKNTALNFHIKSAIPRCYRYKIEGIRIRRHYCKRTLNNNGHKWMKARMIKSQSNFLKRELSGYLFPDTPQKDIWLKSINWRNRFFVKGGSAQDDIFIQIPSTPDMSQAAFKELMIKRQQHGEDQRLPLSLAIPQSPVTKDNSNFRAQLLQDFGVAMVDTYDVEPKRYRHHREGWTFWQDPPIEDLHKRAYKFDDSKPMETEEEDAVKLDSPDENDIYYFAGNQRCLPLPEIEDFTPVSAVPVRYDHIPQLEEIQDNYHTFRTVFNVGTKYNSDFGRFTDGQLKEKDISRLLDFKDKAHACLHVRWSPKDPYVYVYFVIVAYFYGRFRHLYHNYSDSFWENLEGFLKHLEVKNLFRFNSLEEFVIYPGETSLTKLVGGQEYLIYFYPLIKSLRRARLNWWESKLPMVSEMPKPCLEHAFNENHFLESQRMIDQGLPHPMRRERSLPLVYPKEFLPTGILLVGPPGTGKTFLVKALAGSCDCPIIRYKEQSRLNDRYSAEENDQYQKTTVVRRVFKTAIFRAPSILFIDELDTLGAKRHDVLGSAETMSYAHRLLYGMNDLVGKNALSEWQKTALLEHEPHLNRTDVHYRAVFQPRMVQRRFTPKTKFRSYKPNRPYQSPQINYQVDIIKEQQRMVESVTVLLCLLDGMQKRKDVLVIGATNRPAALDPALTRPGRLGEVLYVDLPSKQKRLSLLQLYTSEQTCDNIDWEYFAGYAQTGGLSPAHLKAAMNMATLKLIKRSFEPQQQGIAEEIRIEPQTDLTIQHGLEAVKYRDMYLKQVITRWVKLLNNAGFSPGLSEFRANPNTSCHVTQEIELNDTPKHYYLMADAEGVKKEKPSLPDNRGRGLHRTKPTREKLIRQIADKIYQKRRQKIFFLYLLTEPDNLYLKGIPYYTGKSILPPKPGLDRFNQFFLGRPEKREMLALFRKYLQRFFKPDFLTARLLMSTPYAIGNPLMFEPQNIYATIDNKVVKSNFKWATFPHQNILYYNIIMNKESPSIFPPPSDGLDKFQKKLFDDEVCLERAAYYTAAKALIISLLDDSLCDSIELSLWANVKPFQETRYSQQKFIQSVAKQLVSKQQFEKYLLSLVAGKVGEQFFLMQGNPNNQSDLGISEIQQMGWLANIMIEKGLFYGSATSRSSQTLTTSVSTAFNDFDDHLNKIKPQEFGRKQREYSTPHDWSILKYWWRPKLYYERDNKACFEDGLWTHKVADETASIEEYEATDLFCDPWYEVHAPFDVETYQRIQPKTELKQHMLQQSLNTDVFEEILETSEINWSSLPLMQSHPLFAELIFDCFSRAFHILENNRPLLDHFIHHLYRQGRLTGLEAKRITDEFYQQIPDREELQALRKSWEEASAQTGRSTDTADKSKVVSQTSNDGNMDNNDISDSTTQT